MKWYFNLWIWIWESCVVFLYFL